MWRWLLSFPLGQKSKVMACHLLGLTPLLLFMSPPTEKKKQQSSVIKHLQFVRAQKIFIKLSFCILQASGMTVL